MAASSASIVPKLPETPANRSLSSFQKGIVGSTLVHFSKYVAGSNRLLGSCYYSTMCNCCYCFIAMQIMIFQLPYNGEKKQKTIVYITSRLHQKWSQKTLTQKFPGGHAPRPPSKLLCPFITPLSMLLQINLNTLILLAMIGRSPLNNISSLQSGLLDNITLTGV